MRALAMTVFRILVIFFLIGLLTRAPWPFVRENRLLFLSILLFIAAPIAAVTKVLLAKRRSKKNFFRTEQNSFDVAIHYVGASDIDVRSVVLHTPEPVEPGSYYMLLSICLVPTEGHN